VEAGGAVDVLGAAGRAGAAGALEDSTGAGPVAGAGAGAVAAGAGAGAAALADTAPEGVAVDVEDVAVDAGLSCVRPDLSTVATAESPSTPRSNGTASAAASPRMQTTTTATTERVSSGQRSD